MSHMGRDDMLWRPDIYQNVSNDREKTMIKMYSSDDIAWFIILKMFVFFILFFVSKDHDRDN